MLKTTETIEVKPAQAAQKVDAAQIERIEIDFRKNKADVFVAMGTKSGDEFAHGGGVKHLEVSFGDAARDSFRQYLEDGLKKKLADSVGFDDAKTTVE